MEIDTTSGLVKGPNNKYEYQQPRLLYKNKIGPSISTPIIVGNKVVATGYKGLYLFEFDPDLNFSLLDTWGRSSIESTAIVNDGRLYVGARNGYLYCLGEKE
jgi:outer membrane protein assembly factor BamB